MKTKTIRIIGLCLLLAVWLGLVGAMWFGPSREFSNAERRKLKQLPELSADTLLDGSFMQNFDSYTQDQFPLRDAFRKIKSVFHNYVMGYSDNNNIYIEDGYAAKMEYPLNDSSLNLALLRFQGYYDSLLKNRPIKSYVAVVPDKGYYLAEENGYLSMDYEELFSRVQTQMPWAQYIDLTESLSVTDYYHTDTHWRQEKILPAAQKIAGAMNAYVPQAEDYTAVKQDRDFYGVYYGQAALPMDPEAIYWMESEVLSACKTYLLTIDEATYKPRKELLYEGVYDAARLDGQDLYETYLSGAQAVLRIENPNAKTGKELVVFRDSFGSSMVPLLVENYRAVTLVDMRYVSSSVLTRLMQFTNQDVLFLYSTLVLNTAGSLLQQ